MQCVLILLLSIDTIVIYIKLNIVFVIFLHCRKSISQKTVIFSNDYNIFLCNMLYPGETTKMWLHIDAAYAGASFICPEFRPLLTGVEVNIYVDK